MEIAHPVSPIPAPRSLLAVFIVLPCALVSSVAVMFMMGVAVIRSDDALLRQQGVIEHLRETLITMADAETGQRGYLLTRDDEYLLPYRKARGQVEERLHTLQSLTTGDELPANEVADYIEAANAKFAEMERTIEASRAQGTEAAVQIVQSGKGKILMDRIRALSAHMVQEEQAQAALMRTRTRALTNYRNWVFVGATLANLIFLFLGLPADQRSLDAP